MEEDLPGMDAFIAKDDPAAAEHVLGAIEEMGRCWNAAIDGIQCQ